MLTKKAIRLKLPCKLLLTHSVLLIMYSNPNRKSQEAHPERGHLSLNTFRIQVDMKQGIFDIQSSPSGIFEDWWNMFCVQPKLVSAIPLYA